MKPSIVSLLLFSGVGLYKLCTSDANSDWKAVTQVAMTRPLEEEDVTKIVKLMSKCDLISRDQEEALRHPFVQFWLTLVESNSQVAARNVETLRRDKGFTREVMRLIQNLDQSGQSVCQLNISRA